MFVCFELNLRRYSGGMGFVEPAAGMALVGALLTALRAASPTDRTVTLAPGVFPDADWARYTANLRAQAGAYTHLLLSST